MAKRFALLLLLTVGLVSTAQATLVFSDVSYTSNSVTFTATGDLSGYTLPARTQYFSIGFEGDLFLGGVNPNISWSNAIFAGASIANTGYSGDWASWNEPGAWVRFNPPLSASDIALGVSTTLLMGANVLNTAASAAEIVFNWDVNSGFTTHTELGRVYCDGINSCTDSGQAVPGPAGLVLLAISLLGLGISSRRS